MRKQPEYTHQCNLRLLPKHRDLLDAYAFLEHKYRPGQAARYLLTLALARPEADFAELAFQEKGQQLNIRVGESEATILQAKAASRDMTIGNYARIVLVEELRVASLQEELIGQLVAIRGLAGK